MKTKFVNTSNVYSFLSAMGALKQRGAEEACLLVVDGIPGLGKTHCLDWYVTQNNGIFVRAKKEWTPCWLLRDILNALQITDTEKTAEKLFRQVLLELKAKAKEAARNDEDFIVVLDEIDHICNSARLLETLRDLSDFLKIPFIFVGMGRVRSNIARFPQISSRVGQYVTFHPISFEDVRKMTDELCEIKVSDGLVQYLHDAISGRIGGKVKNEQEMGGVRELKEGIASIERWGNKNPPKDAAAGLTVAEMEGQVLLNDRNTGKPILVKAA